MSYFEKCERGSVTYVITSYSIHYTKLYEIEHATGWVAETGFDFVSDYLNKDMSIDAVMCGNDGIAAQAIHALSERRLAGKVVVVGQDADLDACQRIVEGTQTMTVYKPVEKLV